MYSFIPVGWWEVKLLIGRCSHFIKQQAFGDRNFLPMQLHLVKLNSWSSNTNTVLSPLWSNSDLLRFKMDIFFPVIKSLPALIHRLCLKRLVRDAVWITGLQQPTNKSRCMTSRWCAPVCGTELRMASSSPLSLSFTYHSRSRCLFPWKYSPCSRCFIP